MRKFLASVSQCTYIYILFVFTADMKNRLAENQALVSVKVLDENDNPPTFARLNSQGVYVFVVDWQAPVLQPIARVEVLFLTSF